ncbi:helix-turn-helix transcriptional regulator [Amycolatopsis rifamycinica]|uniref:XRE family transcriptional regulator n=1 Tax=Amycolatopsis rifamycinica TaxID=287986 RepID=A0A066UGL5_9PSEU|nr:helix-turn-helix transcriptional regulator [Amycolatopsis rifamycinica]KDN23299.1 XRE family transcriptional regulator [Amycolatopsis rifamycinica]
MDRAELADFLRRRREALRPDDVGLPPGQRRRTSGLRREEVATLSGMSTDYYTRLEQERGPRPSEQMLAAIARGLRLTLDERDHLFRLAGHTAPARVSRAGHVSPPLMRVLDRLHDTPAQVMSNLGETLVQNRQAEALLGDETRHRGPARSAVYRWFTDPAEQRIYPEPDRPRHARFLVASLRAASATDRRAVELARLLTAKSAEFAKLWEAHEVAVPFERRKTIVHPSLGDIALDCQLLLTDDLAQLLLVFTATPGTEDAEKLQLLSVVGPELL